MGAQDSRLNPRSDRPTCRQKERLPRTRRAPQTRTVCHGCRTMRGGTSIGEDTDAELDTCDSGLCPRVVGNSVKALPQFVRTTVRGKVAGLAPTAVWLASPVNVLWLCFGLSIGDERFIVLMAAATGLTERRSSAS